MDRARNPFSPGAGSQPPELAGRSVILEHVKVALTRVRDGRSERSRILVGLRGVGKTVLLNRIMEVAHNIGICVLQVEACERRSFASVLLPPLRQALFSLDRAADWSDQTKRAMRVMKSLLNSVQVRYADVDIALDVEAEMGTADSGNFNSDLSELFLAIGAAASSRHTAIALLIDELHYLDATELEALIAVLHQVAQRQQPVLMIGTGLPSLLRLSGEAKPYAERLLLYPQVGALSTQDAQDALEKPLRQLGMEFTQEAMQDILAQTEGYPYFIQEWGYQLWNLADHTPIDRDLVAQALPHTLRRLDENFFGVHFDRMTNSEKRYLRAMADSGRSPVSVAEVAHRLGSNLRASSRVRSSLIKKGIIYSANFGEIAYAIPQFDAYLRRVMFSG